MVSTGTSKNKETQRSTTVPLSLRRLGVPASRFRPTSSTQTSYNTSTDLTSRPPSPTQNEFTTAVAHPLGSLTANVVEYERSSPPPSYEVTEWTAFLDRIQRNPSSATYEDLLLLEEVNGPSSSSSARRMGHGTSNQLLNASVGLIELLHRRTTKDGKAKLKMVLAGQRVERCDICLAQFKSGESGALTDCSHTFHESCLLRWVAQSASCPMCRVALAPD